MRRFVFGALLVAIAIGCAASPARPPQRQASAPQQEPSALQRGTKDAPLFVEGVVAVERTQREAERQAEEGKEKFALDAAMARYTGLSALFTLLLLLVGAVQVALFVWQLRLIRSSLADTKEAANAAKTSADATMLAERAYLKLAFTEDGVQWSFKNKPIPSGFEISLAVQNYGRTPASVTDIRIGCSRRAQEDLLPEEFADLTQKLEAAPNGFLVPGDDTSAHRYFGIKAESYTHVMESAERLWVFGYVDYIDMFGKRHRAAIARNYEPIMEGGKDSTLRRSGLRRYDTDRPREQGEGNDWGEKAAVQRKPVTEVHSS